MNLYARVVAGMTVALVLSIVATHWILVDRVRAKVSASQDLQLRASASALAELLQAPQGRDARRATYAKRFGFALTVEPTAAAAAGEHVSARGPVLVTRNGQRVALIGLSDSETLVVGPVPALSSVRGWALLGLLVSIAIVLVAAWLVVVPIVRRIRALEQGTAQLRSGDLTARVSDTAGDAIGSLGTSINHMASEIQRLVDNQTQLLQAVSHEFRTPIARLRFAVEMLATDETEQERASRAESIDENLTELGALVDEILTYGKLDSETATFRTESIDVGLAVRDIVTATEVLRDRVDITVHAHDDTEPAILANRRYFSRVVENLVLNAMRHAKTRVRVDYQAVADMVLIVIHDDGPGVPKDQRQQVWEPFARLDTSRSRESGGFGLGLAIVRRIMDWHGGEAHVEDSELGGAMFVTSWPIDASNKQP